MHGSRVTSCLVALAIAAGPSAWGASGAEAPEEEALRLCRAADAAGGDVRKAMLERALSLATGAVRSAPDRADAHFAVFCALGKQLDDRGVGWGSVGAIRRLRGAVDRALELDPDHVDALVGKATMLLRLPRVLGGDRDEARRCLERARRLGPEHPAGAAMWREVAPMEQTAASH
jgi:tetratricopeptide (TPR) repeat protein